MSIGAAKNIGQPARQTNRVKRVHSPVRGVDTRVAVSLGDPLHCIYTYNLIPYDYGMKVRPGYREHQIGLGAPVHTVIPFEGVASDGADDRLFVVTNEGIYDVSVAGAAPILKATFVVQTPDAGWGTYSHYVTDADNNLLFYADSKNGLFEYDPLTDIFAPVDQADFTGGIVTENINFVVVYKQRIWFIEEQKNNAWYLPVGSKQGACEAFFFDSKFTHGGALAGLYNWSVDGGEGLDDYLVAVSRGGDVLPYNGTDPSDTDTWAVHGTYYIGEVPVGPGVGIQTGGTLYLLSITGLNDMNLLLQGVDSELSGHRVDAPAITNKISERIRSRMVSSLDTYGWDVKLIPSEGGMLINSPDITPGDQLQYQYNFSSHGWGFWSGVPINAFDSYKGTIIFGDADGRVLIMDVPVDDLLLTPVGGVNGRDIVFSVLTGYQPMDAEGLFKRVHRIRADFITSGSIAFNCQPRYDYDLSDADLGLSPPAIEGGLWDSAIWDADMWSAASLIGENRVIGGWGWGRYVAVAMSGETRYDTRFIGWDVTYTTGGSLG